VKSESSNGPDINIMSDLDEIQLRAARMIAMGIPYREIASQIGVDRTTLYRWRKLPRFETELASLAEEASQESREHLVRDISEINDIILGTLLDVAQNDSSGGARVSAARALTELVDRAEERAQRAQYDVMRDQSSEIRVILEEIRAEQES
jgi:transposase-like protein